MADIKKRRGDIDAATNPSITEKSVKAPRQSDLFTKMMSKLIRKTSFKNLNTAAKIAEDHPTIISIPSPDTLANLIIKSPYPSPTHPPQPVTSPSTPAHEPPFSVTPSRE
ncbi:MAG: hypothetical protein Q9194_004241 [Teloschistes cf. exilis]